MIDKLITAAILLLAFGGFLIAGCDAVPETPHYPISCTRYIEPGSDVQYIDMNGNDCALIQGRGDDGLFLVTPPITGKSFGIWESNQRHILGRKNAMAYAEKWCAATKTVILGQ